METVQNVFIFLHFIGLASLLGGFLVQMATKPKVVNNAMLHGALLQLVTGIALVGLVQANKNAGETVNNAAVGIKLLILLVITGLILVYRRRESVSVAIWATIGGLTMVNIAIAVFAGAVQTSS
jgi:hypothetical protein